MFCGPCAVDPLPVAFACAAVAYDVLSRRFVLRAKQGGRPELLVRLGAQLAIVGARAGIEAGCDFVVPVPSHPLLRLRRGFDPAAEVARGYCRRSGLPLRADVLRRRWIRQKPMKGLGARARRAASEGTFRASRLPLAPTVLLVDDVLTTGATARASAATLLEAGAASVRLAVWARTPRERERPSFDRPGGAAYNPGFSVPANSIGRRD